MWEEKEKFYEAFRNLNLAAMQCMATTFKYLIKNRCKIKNSEIHRNKKHALVTILATRLRHLHALQHCFGFPYWHFKWERDFFLKILKIQKRKRFVFQDLINREREFFSKMLKIEKRKRMGLKISQIEKRRRNFS